MTIYTPSSLSTLQNFRYSGKRLWAFLASSLALPTRNARCDAIMHGLQKQYGHLDPPSRIGATSVYPYMRHPKFLEPLLPPNPLRLEVLLPALLQAQPVALLPVWLEALPARLEVLPAQLRCSQHNWDAVPSSRGTAAVRSCGDKSHGKKCSYFYELFLYLLGVVFLKSVLYSGPITWSWNLEIDSLWSSLTSFFFGLLRFQFFFCSFALIVILYTTSTMEELSSLPEVVEAMKLHF